MGLKGCHERLELGVFSQAGLSVFVYEQHKEQWAQVEICSGQLVADQPWSIGLGLEHTEHRADRCERRFVGGLVPLSPRPNEREQLGTQNRTICVRPDTANASAHSGSIQRIARKQYRPDAEGHRSASQDMGDVLELIETLQRQ